MGSEYVQELGLGIGRNSQYIEFLSEHLILFSYSDSILNILRSFLIPLDLQDQILFIYAELVLDQPNKISLFPPKLQVRSVVTSLQHEVERLKEENKEVETVRAGGFFFLSLKLSVVETQFRLVL